MVIFGVITKNEQIITDYIQATNTRLSEVNMVNNPFHGNVKTKELKDGRILHIVTMKPLYFNFTIYGWLITAGILVMSGGWNFWALPGIILGCLGFFWTAPFYKFMYQKALKKAGYRDKIEKATNIEIIEILCETGDKYGATRSA